MKKHFDTEAMKEYNNNAKDRKLEDSLQLACEKYLKSKGIKFLHRHNSIKMKTRKGTEYEKGFPDLTIFTGKGHCMYIELKIGMNGLSPEQEEFRSWAIKNDYEYHVVYDYETFVDIMKWV